jgi:hypothetical protein
MSREATIGIGATVVAIAVALYANLPVRDDGSLLEVLILVGFVALVAGIVFGLVVPWAKRAMANLSNRPATTGIVVSILGFLTIVAFWSGLPVILGAGGAVLGQVGRERAGNAGRGGLAMAALVIGVIAAVGGVAVLVLEQLGI